MNGHLILVVDDQPVLLREIKTKLQVDGFAVVTAGRGEDALPMLNSVHERYPGAPLELG